MPRRTAPKRNYGFIPDRITPEQWKFGAATLGEALVPDGNWLPYLPKGEHQNNGNFDSFNCTAETFTNLVEILWKRLYGEEKNFSARGLGILAGTRPPGNSPHTVCEAARKNGLIDEADLPFDVSLKTVEEYYSPDPLPLGLLKKGRNFLEERSLNHEWVPNTPEAMLEALKYSPLGVGVVAWSKGSDGLYYFSRGLALNHWTSAVVGVKPGKYWFIFDSYPEDGVYLKKVRWDAPFDFVKRIWFGPGEKEKRGILSQILKILAEVLLIDLLLLKQRTPPPPIPPDPPPLPPEPSPEPPRPPKYLWDTPANVRHSIRVLCDEAGLSWMKKNDITATIQAESGFDPKRVSPKNRDGTKDWGLCQFNDGKNPKGVPYWIGPAADFKDTDDVLNNPEKNVRVMIRETKKYGYSKWWSAYTNGSYKQYL